MASQSTISVFSEIDGADIEELYTHYLPQTQINIPQNDGSLENIATPVDEDIAAPADDLPATAIDESTPITSSTDENIATTSDGNVGEPDFRFAITTDDKKVCPSVGNFRTFVELSHYSEPCPFWRWRGSHANPRPSILPHRPWTKADNLHTTIPAQFRHNPGDVIITTHLLVLPHHRHLLLDLVQEFCLG